MTFGFMEEKKAFFPVRFMARRLGVSTSGFYEWRRRQADPCRRDRDDAALLEIIDDIWSRSRETYGSPRVWAELRLGKDIRVGRKRVERLMRRAGIEGAPTSGKVVAPAAIRMLWRLTISSVDSSQLMGRIVCGWPTSPNTPPERARCIWLLWLTPGRGGWWDGRSPII